MGSDVNAPDPTRQPRTAGFMQEGLDELFRPIHVENKTFKHKFDRNVCQHPTNEHQSAFRGVQQFLLKSVGDMGPLKRKYFFGTASWPGVQCSCRQVCRKATRARKCCPTKALVPKL